LEYQGPDFLPHCLPASPDNESVLTSREGNIDGQRNIKLTDDHVLIGKVVKPHGILGEVKVYTFSEHPDNLKQYKRVVLQKPGEVGSETYSLNKSRTQGKLAIVQLQGVDTRVKAEALQGSEVWLVKTEFPGLAPGEYYWHQFVGLQAVTDKGIVLGKISGLFTTGAHDVIVVAGTEREYMIPVIDETIRQIDNQNGRLIITLPPGLLEVYEEE
jgi:16S rRNA processing protein RimM